MNESFEKITYLPDTEIDLAQAALLIAKDEYPQLEIGTYINKINDYSQTIISRLPKHAEAKDIINCLNTYLFEEQGFSGDLDNYYDPRNSYLNEVLDRKRGIPITLSILYIEIGKRLGLEFEGISFPGHFLVRFNVGNGVIILDPYYGGISLDEDELKQRLEDITEENNHHNLEDLLMPASNKTILERILRNLRGLYLYDKQHEKALRSADRMIRLSPHNAEEYLMRGSIYKALECFKPALEDYQHYIKLVPEAKAVDEIRSDIIELRAAIKQLH